MPAKLPLEWLYETLEKRVRQGIKISDLFLIVPIMDGCETEIDYELAAAWRSNWLNELAWQGNILEKDYPTLATRIKSSRKAGILKVFLVNYEKCNKNLLLHKKKYNYPKISTPKSPKSLRNLLIIK